MAYWGDYHTHTLYSHGHSTVMQNVERAVEMGLKEIAITDHGFRHMMYNVRRTAFPDMKKDVEEARARFPQIKIYLGLETNLSSRKGKIDILEEDFVNLDLIVCGYHKYVKTDTFADYWKFFIANMAYNVTKISTVRLRNRNTDAYLRAIERHEIDILSHPGNGFPADLIEVARACKFYGTYFELNGKGNYVSDADLSKMCGEGVEFIVDSDAHSVDRIGEVSKPQAIIDRVGIPYELIANWEKLPKFRSRIKKGLYE